MQDEQLKMPLPNPLIPSSTSAYLLNILHSSEHTPYIGKPISQLTHSLQAAHLALSSTPPAEPQTVIAALLHDIGQFAPESDLSAALSNAEVKDMDSATLDGSVGRYSHDQLGATFLSALGFPEKTCVLVGEHVAAKRYLCGADPAYYDLLSSASKESMVFQGGPMGEEERGRYNERFGEEWVWDICRLRKWDDGAKVEGLRMEDIEGLERYGEMMEEVLKRERVRIAV